MNPNYEKICRAIQHLEQAQKLLEEAKASEAVSKVALAIGSAVGARISHELGYQKG